MNAHRLLAIALGAAAVAIIAWPTAATGDLLDDLTRLQSFEARRASSANPDLSKNGDARPIAPGKTLVLGDLEGPGVITHIWCTVGSDDPFYPRALVLRIYWDEMEQPSVEVPLGDFFGVGHGAFSAFTSLPVVVSSEGRARSCYWRMPFRRRARVTVTNESDHYPTRSFYYYLDWHKRDALPEDTAYFHARYRQETPARPGDYVILDTAGRGHYVGTVYSAHQMEIGWFGEGDDRFYIDGEDYPSLSGTGTEDYFCDAWGFRQFATPFFGVSLWEGYMAGDRVTAYRWHIPDPVTFTQSLRVQMEHRGSIFTDAAHQVGAFVERPDWISSVALWYQWPPVAAPQPLPPLAERVAPYRVLRAGDLDVRADPPMMLQKEGGSVTYLPGTDDAGLELDFEAAQAGTYQISAFLNHSAVGAIYQPVLDGEPLGRPLDLYREGADWLPVRFDLVKLEAGKHTLRFEGRGLSPHRRGGLPALRAIGVFYIMLLRMEDMEGYQVEMNRLLRERREQ